MSDRDITLEDTFTYDFTTRAFTTGIPTTLAGTPVLSVKEGANDTFITAGVTVDVDTGATPVVGLNEASVVATAANGYEAGKSYALFISAGTVGGVSVVGEVIGQFTLEASAAAVALAGTITLPGQTAPPLAPTLKQAIGWLYKVLRNRTDQTAILWQLYADDESTVDAKATVSDDNTTAIKQEIASGP